MEYAHYIVCTEPGDVDCDGMPDGTDNCPDVVNPDQVDRDGDGYGTACDCNDSDGSVHQATEEGPYGDPTCTDGMDNDCDGYIDGDDGSCAPSCSDSDGDGYGSPASPGCAYPLNDCDDDDSNDPEGCLSCSCGSADCAPCARCIHPGVQEFDNDGVDSNCDGKDNRCFIVTASFGTEMQGKIAVLSRFRDVYLLTNDAGRSLVQAYYRYSPPAADYIAKREWLRTCVRFLLLPIVGLLSILV